MDPKALRPRGAEEAATSPASPATTPAKPKDKQDVVLLGPPTADGAGVHVLRAREERIEAGELRALEEGRPVVGEVVSLRPREGNPRVCDVQDSFAAPSSPGARKGPAQVATSAYREGWDQVFAKDGVPSPPERDPRSLN